ncbi:MAG: hypothetical protein ACOYN6_03090 [Ignavibacteria bacterium]
MRQKNQTKKSKQKSIKMKVSVIEIKRIDDKQYTTFLSKPILLNVKDKKKKDISLGDELEVNVGF